MYPVERRDHDAKPPHRRLIAGFLSVLIVLNGLIATLHATGKGMMVLAATFGLGTAIIFRLGFAAARRSSPVRTV